MAKRKHLLLIAILISSISLIGCSSHQTDKPTEAEPTKNEEVIEFIPFSSANIFPGVLKVNAGETLQASVKTYPSNATESGVVWVSQNEEIATVDDTGLITGIKSGTSKISVFGAETNILLGSKILTVASVPQPEEIIHIDVPESTEKTEMSFTYKDYAKKSAYHNLDYCPTIGAAKLLVIPIWFKDSSSFISVDNKEIIRQDIEKAYFGSDIDTGWKSVKTYYEEESNGLITLEGTVSKWRDVKSSYTYFGNNSNATSNLVKESVNWFFDLPENSSLSRSDFDGDSDGYLDGVMLIYGAPDQSALGSDDGNLWAYTSWLLSNPSPSYPVPNVFFWASYDFMYSNGSYALEKTGKTMYGSGFTSNCFIDTHTFIHEMGHVFGLDDYYDYSGQYIPAGGFSMQDYNIGGHDPFSVMAYGWAKPNVVTDSTELVIETFQKSRDLILLSPKWNGYKSPFDEYILLELYSPTGLNQFDCEHRYGYYGQGPNTTAIRMWHVDARLASFDSNDNITLTTNVNNPGVGVITAFNNTYYREGNYSSNGRISIMGVKYANHNLLQLIRNDKTETFKPKSFLNEKSLFKTGTYNLKDYATQFVNGDKEKFNNGESLDWTIEITIGVSDNDSAAIVKITKNS